MSPHLNSYLPRPAHALQKRLQIVVGEPSWARFLPQELLLELRRKETQIPSRELISDRGCEAVRYQCISSESLRGGIAHGSKQKRASAIDMKDVWQMSCDRDGCRLIQERIENYTSEQKRSFAAQLRGRVWEALRDPNANYVLAKFITASIPKDCDFVIDEIMRAPNGAVAAAKHQFGCRIVERLMEYCTLHQTRKLVEDLLQVAPEMCKHPYGNYVMQHIFEHGAAEHKRALCLELERKVETFAHHQHASAVIGKALCFVARDFRVSLAHALIQVPGLLVSIADTKHGHVTAKLALQNAEDRYLKSARDQFLAAEIPKKSKYFRIVLEEFNKTRDSPHVGGA
mmetsp:Transcript_122866/g.191860  ORF Transcript_122866/g.191860 Transcript_122866/m.191860 type:complete len:343 (+) Transcript_122866:2-1030(+)